MPNDFTPERTRYLGDGVYATYTGWGLELRKNHHENPVTVYLEPDVLKALNTFFKQHDPNTRINF